MTPKEKAEELYNKYHDSLYSQRLETEVFNDLAEISALIAVDELILYSQEWDDSEYWQQVKQEIEAL